jgi:uncharacterized membrane protein HdeD (DUF308 family)
MGKPSVPGPSFLFPPSARILSDTVRKYYTQYKKFKANLNMEIIMTETTDVPDGMINWTSLLPWWLVLLWGLLSLIIGIMFLATPLMTIVILITFMGAYWLVSGLFTIGSLASDKTNMGLKIFLSIVNILAGIVILLSPLYSTAFILGFFAIFIGFWALFYGAVHLFQAFKTKDIANAVLGIVCMIFGLIILIRPIFTAELIPLILGVFAVMSGIAAIIAAFQVKKVTESPT